MSAYCITEQLTVARYRQWPEALILFYPKRQKSGFDGLEVACWPLVPKFAVSNPAQAVGFFQGEKNPQYAFLRKGSKALGPVS
jgi:hypothetical protein